MNFVPRIWETLYGEFQREVGRRRLTAPSVPTAQTAESQVMVEQRQ